MIPPVQLTTSGQPGNPPGSQQLHHPPGPHFQQGTRSLAGGVDSRVSNRLGLVKVLARSGKIGKSPAPYIKYPLEILQVPLAHHQADLYQQVGPGGYGALY